jgi:hypothetical protein
MPMGRILSQATVFLTHVQSLANKVDKIRTSVAFQRDIRDCNIIHFTKHGFLRICCQSRYSRLDSQCVAPTGINHLSRKKKGRGVCFLINNSWCNCNNIQELKSFCSRDLEFLTIKCRLYYLPMELSLVIVTAVYIPPQADITTALKELHWTL